MENILRNTFVKQDFEMCILKFGSGATKVCILGGQLMRSNPDYSGLKGWYHEESRMEVQGFDN